MKGVVIIMEKNPFSQILKQHRKQCALTQQQIADALDIDRSTYTYYETGKTYPTIPTLIKITKILNITIGGLLGVDAPANTAMVSDNVPGAYDRYSNLVDEYGKLTNDEKKLLVLFRLQPQESKTKSYEAVYKISEQSHK